MTAASTFPSIRAPLMAIMLFQVAALFLRSMLDTKLLASGVDAEHANNLSYLLVVPAVEVILFWPIIRANKDSLRALFPAPESWPRVIAFGIALGLAARLAGWSLIIAAGTFGLTGFAPPGYGTQAMIWFSCPPPVAFLTAVLVAAILIPLGEEIINRGLILGKLLQVHTGSAHTVAVILSALLFTILHEVSGMPAAFLIGILLAILVIRCQSLLPAIIAHATYNLLRVLDWTCLHVVLHPQTATRQSDLLGGGALIVGLLSCSAAVWLAVYARTGTRLSSRPR
jgi:membrane protease YdiL (CAAX protease family)